MGRTEHRSRWARARLDDHGLSVVEVMVAITLLLFMMTAVASGIVTALRATELGADRTAATQVATRVIELERAKSFDTILSELGLRTSQEELDGRVYDVTVSSYWVGVDSSGDPCATTTVANSSSVVRVEVDVVPQQDGIAGVGVDTVIAPPGGTTRPDAGTLIVQVVDHEGEPIPLALVEAAGTTNLGTGTTRANGCITFGNVSPGDYVVDVTKSGYVAPDDVPLATDPGVPVTSNTTHRTVLQMAPAATATITPTTSVAATLPDVAGRWYQLKGGERTHVLAATELGLVDGLFPEARYAVAGTCPDADPFGTDADGDRIWTDEEAGDVVMRPLEPGATTEIEARYAVVRVRTKASFDTISASNVDCVGGQDELSWAPNPANSDPRGDDHLVAVPFGTWEFSATCSSRTDVVTIEPRDAGTEVDVNLRRGPDACRGDDDDD